MITQNQIEDKVITRKQEMPSQPQKSQNKGFERYLMLGPSHILVNMSWNDGSSPGHENICRWFLDTYK